MIIAGEDDVERQGQSEKPLSPTPAEGKSDVHPAVFIAYVHFDREV